MKSGSKSSVRRKARQVPAAVQGSDAAQVLAHAQQRCCLSVSRASHSCSWRRRAPTSVICSSACRSIIGIWRTAAATSDSRRAPWGSRSLPAADPGGRTGRADSRSEIARTSDRQGLRLQHRALHPRAARTRATRYGSSRTTSTIRNRSWPIAIRFIRPSSSRFTAAMWAVVPTVRNTWAADLRAGLDEHHPKGSLLFDAAADHQFVPLLEDVQRERHPRKEHGVSTGTAPVVHRPLGSLAPRGRRARRNSGTAWPGCADARVSSACRGKCALATSTASVRARAHRFLGDGRSRGDPPGGCALATSSGSRSVTNRTTLPGRYRARYRRAGPHPGSGAPSPPAVQASRFTIHGWLEAHRLPGGVSARRARGLRVSPAQVHPREGPLLFAIKAQILLKTGTPASRQPPASDAPRPRAALPAMSRPRLAGQDAPLRLTASTPRPAVFPLPGSPAHRRGASRSSPMPMI